MRPAGLSVAWTRHAADIDSRLWADCFAPPLEGRWWYETLEASGLEDQFVFFYALIKAGGDTIAIAPVFLMDLPIGLVVPPVLLPAFELIGRLVPSAKYQRTLFVGSPCADQGTVGSLPGADRGAILDALQTALVSKAAELDASMVVWKDFPASDAEHLGQLARRAGLFPAVSFPGTVVELPGSRKEDYLAALTRMRRHNLKKKLVRSASHVVLDVEILREPDAATLEALFALFTQTYDRATTRFERLDRRFFAAIASANPSHFVVLRERASGEMVAFMLCFELGPRIINKFIGIDYGRPKDWFLYFRLWDALLDWSCARGATEIQSGQTGYRAKISLGHRLVALTNYCRHRNPVLHWIYARVARSIGWRTLDAELADHLDAHPESLGAGQ